MYRDASTEYTHHGSNDSDCVRKEVLQKEGMSVSTFRGAWLHKLTSGVRKKAMSRLVTASPHTGRCATHVSS